MTHSQQNVCQPNLAGTKRRLSSPECNEQPKCKKSRNNANICQLASPAETTSSSSKMSTSPTPTSSGQIIVIFDYDNLFDLNLKVNGQMNIDNHMSFRRTPSTAENITYKRVQHEQCVNVFNKLIDKHMYTYHMIKMKNSPTTNSSASANSVTNAAEALPTGQNTAAANAVRWDDNNNIVSDASSNSYFAPQQHGTNAPAIAPAPSLSSHPFAQVVQTNQTPAIFAEPIANRLVRARAENNLSKMSILPRVVPIIRSHSNTNDLKLRQIENAKLSKAIDEIVIMMKRLKLLVSPEEQACKTGKKSNGTSEMAQRQQSSKSSKVLAF